MTTARPHARLERIVERGIGLLAWTCQAIAAGAYLAIARQWSGWDAMFAKNPASAITIWATAGLLVLLWGLGQWQEQRHSYHSLLRPLHRKIAFLGHGGTLGIALLLAAEHDARIALWGVLLFFALTAASVWGAWMRTQTLPPEDQAVVDEVLAHHARRVAAEHDVHVQERRRERLTAALAALGHRPTDGRAEPAPQQPVSTPPRWQIPARKHAPLVYFVRNGNRLKIGTTTCLKKRIRTLALRPENVVLLLAGGPQLERALHRQFADLRIGTTEWFAYDGPLIDYVHTETTRAARKEQPK